MNHQDHVALLRPLVPATGGRWADFGSGDGAFTLALREIIGPAGEIFSVDKDKGRLAGQRHNFHSQFPASKVRWIQADFTRPLDLPPLDGIVAANALHFHRDQETLLRQWRGYLREGGRLVVVEYNVDSGNPWVPFPLSFETFRRRATRAGFAEVLRGATRPSRFLGEIYSAVALTRVLIDT